jgi:hypothetical protein
MIGAYSSHQQQLLDRVTTMREVDRLTFDGIAIRLRDQGLKSARGRELQAEHVFSIYKKGKLRLSRLNSEPSCEFG